MTWQKGRPAEDLEMTWNEGFSKESFTKKARGKTDSTWYMERAKGPIQAWWTSRKGDGKEKLAGMGVGKGSRPRVTTLPLRCLYPLSDPFLAELLRRPQDPPSALCSLTISPSHWTLPTCRRISV